MALYKVLTKKDGPLLISVQTCRGSSLSRREIERANEDATSVFHCSNNQFQLQGRGTQRRKGPESEIMPLKKAPLSLSYTLQSCWVAKLLEEKKRPNLKFTKHLIKTVPQILIHPKIFLLYIQYYTTISESP